MAQRHRITEEGAHSCTFQVMEVVICSSHECETSRLILVDSHQETMRFVQRHLDLFAENVVRVEKYRKDSAARR